VLCGGIASYNARELPPEPKNYLSLIVQRARMKGFVVLDYRPQDAEAIGALAGWMQAGKIKNSVGVPHGLENAPAKLTAAA
jgi:NADPH-dependent curcumin reductase CurA